MTCIHRNTQETVSLKLREIGSGRNAIPGLSMNGGLPSRPGGRRLSKS